MAKLDKRKLRASVGKFSAVKSSALEIAQSKLNDNIRLFTSEFESHEVTKEIFAGASSANSSMTLGGYGNLFSFIGFNKNDNPIINVINTIKKIRIIKKSFSKEERDGFIVSYNVYVPSIADFEDKAPMPWAPGRSWLLGIERGISGFGAFISKALEGRSSGGIQSPNRFRSGVFRNVSYFSKMYNNFLNRIKN
jgi:hypothetical protein